MAYVKAREDETIESLIRRFKKKVDGEKILKEYKDRQYFKKPSLIKNEHNRKIRRRNLLNKRLGLNKSSQDL